MDQGFDLVAAQCVKDHSVKNLDEKRGKHIDCLFARFGEYDLLCSPIVRIGLATC